MQKPLEECSSYKYLIAPYQIHYLRFIMEAYPGIAVVSTIDSTLGLVSIAVAPGCESDILDILESERDALGLIETGTSRFERNHVDATIGRMKCPEPGD